MCSVAVGTPGSVTEQSSHIPRQHNQQVLSMVDETLRGRNVKRSGIQCVAFSAGPGSFTGVRLAASIAQGIALGLGCQVFPVQTATSFALIASKYRWLPDSLRIARRSRRDLYYEAMVRLESSELAKVKSEKVVKESDIRPGADLLWDWEFNLDAGTILALAAIQSTKWSDPISAIPIYVDGDHPWQARDTGT